MSDSRKRLQLELSGLKSELGSRVALKKAKDGLNAPFPISIFIKIDRPKSCDHYDVDMLLIKVVIREESGRFECDVSVTNQNLPKVLRSSISLRLQEYLRHYKSEDSTPIGIVPLCAFVKHSYGSLLSLKKELVEPYEVSDPVTGRSVRRIAILNGDSCIEIDTSLPDTQSPDTLGENAVPDYLEKDIQYLSNVFGKDFRCILAKKSYMKSQTSDKIILEYLHSKIGVGSDLQHPVLQHAKFHLTVTMLPTSQEWRDLMPAGEADTRLVLNVFVGEMYPRKSSVVFRIQFADESLFAEEYSPLVLAFEKILLYKALAGISDALEIKDIVKYCANHADEALIEAMSIWEEAQIKKKNAPEDKAPAATSEPEASTRYVVSLHGLQMDGIDAMTLHNLNIEVACKKCRFRNVIPLKNLALRWNTAKTTCSVCDHAMTIFIQVRIVHGSSNVICILACIECTPMDILPCTSLEVQCHCSDTSLMKDQFQQSRWNEKNCRECHRREAYRFDRIVFEEIQRKSSNPLKSLKRISPIRTLEKTPTMYDHNAALVHGQPLPDYGTCMHYHHSHRWLRFPCCGRRYPCDLCHEEMTDGHEMKWANRMVCGYCSLEQRVDSRCSGCSKKLTTSSTRPEGKNTCFWEGGTGQRNKKRLSKKDPHKFRNSKSKTVSKKAAAKHVKK